MQDTAVDSMRRGVYEKTLKRAFSFTVPLVRFFHSLGAAAALTTLQPPPTGNVIITICAIMMYTGMPIETL
jgi:hypothetical protein